MWGAGGRRKTKGERNRKRRMDRQDETEEGRDEQTKKVAGELSCLARDIDANKMEDTVKKPLVHTTQWGRGHNATLFFHFLQRSGIGKGGRGGCVWATHGRERF